ncbi:hypothetical protein LEP1GSC193_1032 [Leptospira alstonii serovar Pingchang str. 80-412]|uniref:Uncharacterized protein n=2 Tax=Leptospira alstonii TaxID=28452 RepID=M6CFY5_9LEPT|nr:hypothetical protein LEP1GSC194_1079 [Leptospira alstonii serovar Sichuan str. 79601]EQA82392.1 hypothetical protein LEP1GSC193_1032 [Leptospira alstonii serovar Pingchang str. 80-412]
MLNCMFSDCLFSHIHYSFRSYIDSLQPVSQPGIFGWVN